MATSTITSRPAEWLNRYGPPELLSLTTTLLVSWAVLALTGNVVLAAVAATWADGLAYYGVIVGRTLSAAGCRSPLAILAAARNLVLEFGPAEIFDSLLIRPAALSLGLTLIPWPAAGALAGKFAADVLFYLPTITSYELLRRRERVGGKENGR